MADHAGAEPLLSKLNSGFYDLLNNLVMVVFPGLGALYFGLAQIWALPEPEKVVGTITVVTIFLGLFVKKAKNDYDNSDAKYDGVMVIDKSIPGALGVSGLKTNGAPMEDLLEGNQVLLKLETAKDKSERIPIDLGDSQ